MSSGEERTLAHRMEHPKRYTEPKDRNKRLGVYTTGMIATICAVSPRTVFKWFDSGRLKGYRIPNGSNNPKQHGGDRRVREKELVEFMIQNGIPLPPFLQSRHSIVTGIGQSDLWALPGWEYHDAFSIGTLCAGGRIGAAIVGDCDGVAVAVRIANAIKTTFPYAGVVVVVSESAPQDIDGWDGKVLRRPVDLEQLGAVLLREEPPKAA